MKILYVEHASSGHRKIYFNNLIKDSINDNEVILIAPFSHEQVKSYKMELKSHSIYGMNSWLRNIYKIAKSEKPDIIHFLSGDCFYRFIGFGLGKFKKYKVVMTFHHLQNTKRHNVAIKQIFAKIDIGVVHTKTLIKRLIGQGIKNGTHIEYPSFSELKIVENAKEKLGLPSNTPILACIGGTRNDKGLDILLDAIAIVDSPFHLLIAGKEEFITKEIIHSKIKLYEEKVTTILKFLSDEEMELAVNAANIIVLPYRKSFDGASGPLVDGVALGKMIIGPNHGSLGEIIRENHLGYTFEAENQSDLVDIIKYSLDCVDAFVYDDFAKNYSEKLKVSTFIKKYEEIYKIVELNGKRYQ